MKNNARVKLDFMGFKKGELIMFCMYVSLLLFACTFMITPPFTKVEFDAAIKDYQSKAVAAMGKDPAKVKLKDAAEAELKKMARMLSSYVDMMCYGNYDEINQTGFTVYSQDGHSGQIEFTVRQGITSGQVIAEWPKDQNNHGYVFRYSIDEEGLRDIFTEVNIGKTECTVDGLIPGKVYIFSYSVVYTSGKAPFCDPIIMMVI